MNDTHLHWIVWAYVDIDPVSGNCRDNVTLDLLAATADEALARAEAIMPSRQYRIHSVIEHFDGACN